MTKHVHYACIVAFAEGKPIQWRESNDKKWCDWASAVAPVFFPEIQYRVKPEVKKCRVALFKFNQVSVCKLDDTAQYWENESHFVRWITDWIEYE